MIIGIDFDGTIVEHRYPVIGLAVPHAARVMKRLVANGHKLILYTMRSDRVMQDENDKDVVEDYLQQAVDYIIDNCDVAMWAINKNPEQAEWTSSPKVYCQIYIDDAALGCPLIYPPPTVDIRTEFPEPEHHRPYVDWMAVERQLTDRGLFTEL